MSSTAAEIPVMPIRMQNFTSKRINNKSYTTFSQRRLINKSRQKLSDRIRKCRRSHFVKRKRTFNENNHSGCDLTDSNKVPIHVTNPNTIPELTRTYLNTLSGISLHSLQTCIASTTPDVVSSSLRSLLTERIELNKKNTICKSVGEALVDALTDALLPKSNSDINISIEIQLDAARLLTNLAATNSYSYHCHEERSDIYEYYGRISTCWCTVLVESAALSSLIKVVSSLIKSISSSLSTHIVESNVLNLWSQCCWAIGNLAADSKDARITLIENGAIAPLSTTVCIAKRLEHITLCRDAMWALSNMARGEETSGLSFGDLFSKSKVIDEINDNWTLSTKDILDLLSAYNDTNFHIGKNIVKNAMISELQSSNVMIKETSWKDVSIDTVWFLVFLSGKEDSLVEALMAKDGDDDIISKEVTDNTFQLSLPEVLSECLHNSIFRNIIIREGKNQRGGEKDINEENDMFSIILPCIRCVGNIASSCDGKFIKNLTSTTLCGEEVISIPHSLSALIRTCTMGRVFYDINFLVPEAAWAAGALLCDFGRVNHPSTTLVGPILFSDLLCAVCMPLYDRNNGRQCLNIKRECLSALWNAMAEPPTIYATFSAMPIIEQKDDISLRDTILVEIMRLKGFLPTLVQFLAYSDTDIIYISLHVINAILRRVRSVSGIFCRKYTFKYIIIQFDEANLECALETLCDRVSATYSYGRGEIDWNVYYSSGQENIAEMAASILDDFYEKYY